LFGFFGLFLDFAERRFSLGFWHRFSGVYEDFFEWSTPRTEQQSDHCLKLIEEVTLITEQRLLDIEEKIQELMESS